MVSHGNPPPHPDLDRILRRALEETAGRLPLPDPTANWRQVKASLTPPAPHRGRRYLGGGAAVAAAFLLLLLVAVHPAQGWNPWQVISRFFTGPGDTGLVQLGSRLETGQQPPPPPDAPEGYREVPPAVRGAEGGQEIFGAGPVAPPVVEAVSLEEAARRAPFPVRSPAWLPPDTAVLRVTYQSSASPGGVGEVELHLGGPEGRDLYFSQRGPLRQFGSGTGFDRDNTRVRQVEIEGTTGILLDFLPDGSSSLEWFSQGVLYRLRSDWDGDATLRIARSLRVVRP